MKKYRKVIELLFILLLTILSVETKVYAAEHSVLLEQLLEVSQEGNIYEVKQDGSGNFSTIQQGVDCVESGDTLLIYPGVYEENVMIMDKTVNLVGVSKENCILTANSDNYHYVPLTIGAGKVYNMTICGTDSNGDQEVPPSEATYNIYDLSSIYEWQNDFPGYAIHIDQNYSYGKELYVENCKIISNNNQCVGIGCRGESKITFSNCEMLSDGGGGCIFFHNTQNPEMAGDAQLVLKDCELKNYNCPYVIAFHSMTFHTMENFNPVYLTFQNVKVSTVAYERKGEYNGTNMNQWFDVDQLENAEIQSALTLGGYYSSLGSELIHQYSQDDSYRLYTQVRENESLLENQPQIAEGITYIKMIDNSETYMKQEKLPEVKARTRHVIDIENVDKEAIMDGWCGLSGIYLTMESYGNTLIEMNYPQIIME
ncbi:MAG: hypothetical protein IJO85_08135 [Lachnospiraceae bacterium]|nr:hypothetical protein [Lachnospiraceae bacterium]